MDRHIALGFFDGVHRGHGALLENIAAAAKESGGRACAMTFDTHPEKVISGRFPPLLGNVSGRTELMRRLYGIEEVIVLPFDETLMRMPWDIFVRQVLFDKFKAAHIVVGSDFRFGDKGNGSAADLRSVCLELGVKCDIIQKIAIDGITVSSTYVRELVGRGDMERAELFLGHPHTLYGKVCAGRHIGSRHGFPTANLDIGEDIIVPARGVYASFFALAGEDLARPSVTYIGARPTVDKNGTVKAETRVFDFNGDLYGKDARVELLAFLRSEQKFESLDALGRQVKLDTARCEAEHKKRGVSP